MLADLRKQLFGKIDFSNLAGGLVEYRMDDEFRAGWARLSAPEYLSADEFNSFSLGTKFCLLTSGLIFLDEDGHPELTEVGRQAILCARDGRLVLTV